jgi:hypothetical protein
VAIANDVLAHHLLGQEKESRERVAPAIERFPSSTRLRALWIQSADREKTYGELLNATPGHMRKDAEVASALCRRAVAGGMFEQAVEHARDAVVDKPKWSQARLLLAETYFARVAMAERTTKPLTVEVRDASLAKSLSAADDTI